MVKSIVENLGLGDLPEDAQEVAELVLFITDVMATAIGGMPLEGTGIPDEHLPKVRECMMTACAAGGIGVMTQILREVHGVPSGEWSPAATPVIQLILEEGVRRHGSAGGQERACALLNALHKRIAESDGDETLLSAALDRLIGEDAE